MTEDPSHAPRAHDDSAPAIEALLAAIADVTKGNLRARVQLPDGSPERFKELGEGLNELITAWRASELRARKAKRSLEEKVATIEAQMLTIRELSTPILQIWRDVLLLPLVGGINETRRRDISSTLLARIAQQDTSHVIIDLTGVESVDESTASHLLRLVRLIKLLGARCVTTGVPPAVAEMFVDLGVDLGELETLQTLEKGLIECVRRGAQERSADLDDDLADV
jgi:rsbT co-antagonist protein RsbR